MARRMPVLRQDDVLEALGERIHERHDLVAFLHREPAAGAKVVLHVDDDQGILDSGLDLRRRRHPGFPLSDSRDVDQAVVERRALSLTRALAVREPRSLKMRTASPFAIPRAAASL